MTVADAPRVRPTRPLIPVEPGIKIAAQMSPEPSEEDLSFVRQMGVDYAVVWTDAAKSSAEYYAGRRQVFEQHGMRIYGFGNSDVHNQDAIVLGGPNQEAKIEEYLRHIRALGQAGIPYTTYAHMGNGIWSTEPEETRGGARARAYDLAKAQNGHWHGKTYSLPLTNEREYTEEEVWQHFERFIRRVVPVAEAAGVRIGIHPDDPPVPRLGGVPRIFSTFDRYVRALDIADSPNVGVCLCAGCWLEGGEMMGKSVVDAIHYFGKQRKLFKIHFRNVEAPLPHFVETFLDSGYFDMYQIMKALREVDFDGVVIPDHIPRMAGGPRVGTAFSIGYMKALLQRANEEAGGSR
jgi:mannonate dehydratase